MESCGTHRLKDERELVKLCAEGDPGAWDRIVTEYGGLIYSVIQRYRLHYQVKRELFVHVLEKLWENDARRIKAWKGRCRFSTYLATVASRICSDYLRGRFFREGKKYDSLDDLEQRSEAVYRPGRSPEPAAERAHRRALRGECEVLLEGLVSTLPGEERSILELFYWQGRRYSEVATILNISVSDVGRILCRARDKLRARLAGKGIKKVSDLME